MAIAVRRILATAALVLLAGFAVLGVTRVAAPTGTLPGRAAAADPAPAVDTAPGDFAEDLVPDLDAVLAADEIRAAPDRAAVRGELRRLAAWRRLVHATVVVDRKDGGLTTVQLDHGTISAVGATSLTIAEAGGTSVTVALGSETRIRRDGAKAAIADLKPADEVFVMSRVESDGTVAYLVVVPRR